MKCPIPTQPMTLQEYRALPKKKASKYSNEKTKVDSIQFDSKKEAKRYGELKMLEKAGEISDLNLQRVYRLVVNGKLVCKYKADFDYMQNGKRVVEDAKGFRTSTYRLKAKLFEAIYDFKILET